MGVGAAQGEVHPRGHVRGAPIRFAVGLHGGERAVERAVGIGLARPDVALVEMRVAIDEAGKHDSAGEIDGRRVGRAVKGDAAPVDPEIGRQEALRVRRSGQIGRRRGDARARQPIGAVGDGPAGGHVSRLTALSCQRRSARWLIRVVAPKIATPASAISRSAANIRGMLSR